MALSPEIVRAAVQEIEAAFAGLSPPGDADLLHPQCMDDGDIVEFYGAPDVSSQADDFFVRNYAAPSFFSAAAFRYYMPAFMIWSLTHNDSPEYAPESTIRAFDPTNDDPKLRDFQISKFALFDERQRAAVVRFLQTFAADPDLGPIADEALKNYWLQDGLAQK